MAPITPVRGRVVAITGGARGIGRATAQELLRRGARVAIGDLQADLVQQTATELGSGVRGYALDVTDRASFSAFLEAVAEDFGGLDVLINNAGIMPLGDFVDESDEVAARQIAINLTGVIFGTKLALPAMLERGSGHIVNIASAAGKVGTGGGATYCATKHAVVGLSEAVRAEARGRGVQISVVMPTIINTELGSGVGATPILGKPEPAEVGTAIAEALERPRFEVYVPRALGPIFRVMRLLPRPTQDLTLRLLGANKALTQIDHGARSAYDQRVADVVDSTPVPR